jgi:phage terminase large subunit-like protein
VTIAAPAPPAILSAGPRFAQFCSTYIRQTKGRWAALPLELATWELDFWTEALEIDPATGRRVYQEVGLGVPTKNGKSTQASAAGLYFLVADGEAEPEVIVAAAARPQARIVFGQSRRMALASPLLLDHLRVLQHSLEAPRTGGIMRAVSADAALQHGGSPSANVIDEIHAHKNGDLYTALTKSGAARDQPFTLWITTAGGSGEGLLAELYGQMFAGNGELEKRPGLTIWRDRVNGILVYWYGADKDDDVEDPALWARVNPSLGITIEPHWLSGQFAKMKARNDLLGWKMYHLNMFVDRLTKAVSMEAFKACRNPDLELQAELPVGVGIYKSVDGETCSIVIAQRQGEAVVVRAIHVPVDATGTSPPAKIREHLRRIREEYPVAMSADPKTRAPLPGPAFAFASYNLRESAAELAADGLNMVEFPLYASTMAPASTMVQDLIATNRLAHDGDLVLVAHVDATDARFTDRGTQWQAAKAPAHNPSAVAMVPAVAMAMQDPPKPLPAPVYGSFTLP